MKIEDQVVSLEIAKKLKELGVKQESLFYWLCSGPDQFDDVPPPRVIRAYEFTAEFLERLPSAFTVAELGELLPEEIHKNDMRFQWKVQKYRFQYENRLEEFSMFGKTEAEARGKMLILLLENKIL